MKEKIQYNLFGRHLSLQERMFRMFLSIGCIANAVAFIETLILKGLDTSLIPLLALLISIVIALVVTFKYRRNNIAGFVVNFAMVVVVFPDMFLENGAIEGGASIWFIVSIVYTFWMFNGKRLLLFVAFDIIADVSVYLLAYYNPQMVTSLGSRFSIFSDSLFSLLVVSLAIGGMIKFQNKVYEQERLLVEEQKRQLEMMSKSKDRFFASMSHEIRTPINTVIGLNEMILRKNPQGETRDYAANVQNASKMLLNIVNDILDFSQMEMKDFEIVESEYEIEGMIQDIIRMMQIQVKNKNLDFQYEISENIPSVLYGDVKRIQQVLINLLTNAVKYTPEGSVSLIVSEDQMEDEQVSLKFQVIDTGIGIRKEDIAVLYDVFKRVDTKKNRGIQGTGLGLNISKQLVDLMNGTISIDSIYTKGSTFTVTLPQKIIDQTPIGAFSIERGNGSNHKEYQQLFEAPEARVLVVDDNEMNRLVVEELLSNTKVRIDMASSGKECLEKTMEHHYHVILLDHIMPDMDGMETLVEIRKQENGLCRESAVVALTANNNSGAAKMYLNAGFDAFLEKPVNPQILEETLYELLSDELIEYHARAEENKQTQESVSIRKKKKPIRITTDCVAELPEYLKEEYDIGVISLYIKTPDGRFRDTEEIDNAGLRKYQQGEVFSASSDSVSVDEYEAFFSEHLDQAEEVIHISMASNSGQSYQVAVSAARGFDHVTIVDSKVISCAQSLIVLHAAKLAKARYSAEEILNEITRLAEKIDCTFVIPGATAFYKSGYTNRAVDQISRLFRLRPVLGTKKSRLQVIGFKTGNMFAARMKLLKRRLRHTKNINTQYIFIAHVGLSVKEQKMIRSEVAKRVPFENIIIQDASVSCACNAGFGSLGYAFIREKDEDK